MKRLTQEETVKLAIFLKEAEPPRPWAEMDLGSIASFVKERTGLAPNRAVALRNILKASGIKWQDNGAQPVALARLEALEKRVQDLETLVRENNITKSLF